MSPAEIAKGALRRLAQSRQEPTPDNFARAYAEEAGQPPPPDHRATGAQWAGLIERLVRGLERGSRQWTPARKKDSLQRVLEGSSRDAARLQQRLQSLLQAWDNDTPLEGDAGAPDASPLVAAADGQWPRVTRSLQSALSAALPSGEPRAAELADELALLAGRLAAEGASAELVGAIETATARAQRLLGHRHRLFDDLGRLCAELGAGLVDLAEDDSWARGQCELLQTQLSSGVGARGVRTATELLAETRERQRRVRDERAAASRALRDLIQRLLGELGELDDQAGRFGDSLGQHAEAIARADSLESLAGVVQALVAESQAVGQHLSKTRQRLQQDHTRAAELEQRVRSLESELRRLSDEASTDALTAVANRRGLQQAFETELVQMARSGHAAGASAPAAAPTLAVGLIDIDNFKKLNDSLGHAAGDVALKSLAAAVRDRLRPVDTVARFGGEEFVVLLPATPADEAQQVLTRLQRELTASLFMHDGREVFVTFSAGVTAWRSGETLDTALERADEALYEAKRTGKNRTCLC
ncbi:MAG: diguanylate cyclase [Burkholderiaceae bacterium]|nr:diguanylate cyclase [Burkholderiaceae bacterium]